MTVSSSLAYKSYAGNGVTTAFATTFQFFDNTDLVVSRYVTATGVETLQTLSTHYTVSGGDGSTGTVTMLTAPPTGTTLIIRRAVPYTQPVDYISNDSFPAETHEEALDRVTMLAQQVASRALSSPALPSTFDPLTTNAPVVPLPVAGKVLIGNSGATGWVNATLTDQVTINGLPVSIASLAAGDLLRYNGAAWANVPTLGLSNLSDITGPVALARLSGTGAPQSTSLSSIVDLVFAGSKLISGWTYQNDVTDVTNDIAFAAGAGFDDTGAHFFAVGALIKRLDATFTAGNNNGMLDTGAVANSNYDLYAINNPTTGAGDYLAVVENAAPSMPSGFTYRRKIGWIKRAGGLIVLFNTYLTPGGGLDFRWRAPRLDVDLLNTLTTSRRTDALSVPLFYSTTALVRVMVGDAGSVFTMLVGCPDETDAAPSTTASPGASIFSGSLSNPELNEDAIRTSSTGTIFARSLLATVDAYRVVTYGFISARG